MESEIDEARTCLTRFMMCVRDDMVARGDEFPLDEYVRLKGRAIFECYVRQIHDERRFNYQMPRVSGVTTLSDKVLPTVVTKRIDTIVEQFRELSSLRESFSR
ncbi:MAG TPA: hypothetical protein VMV59_08900 [Candidatus Dormibacteraeota bacterium]|nr:hypothetical protein [Candidatus Dormibacteraeota bacterium]